VEPLKASGFEVFDVETDARLELNKEVDGLHVQVKFQYKNPSPEMEDEQQEEESYLDFQVNVVKDNKGLSFDCSAMANQVIQLIIEFFIKLISLKFCKCLIFPILKPSKTRINCNAISVPMVDLLLKPSMK